MMNDKLEQLQKYLEKMEQFNHVNTLLYWDMRTNTPKEGFAGHSDALTYFSTEQFSMSTSDELKTLLDTLAEPEEFEKLDEIYEISLLCFTFANAVLYCRSINSVSSRSARSISCVISLSLNCATFGCIVEPQTGHGFPSINVRARRPA